MEGFTTYMKISNNITANPIESDFKFEYFDSCKNNNTSLGSNTQIMDSCKNPNEINMNNIDEDKLCNSLWNNNTKRKMIVDTGYKKNVEDFIINDNPFKDTESKILNNLSLETSLDTVDVSGFNRINTNTRYPVKNSNNRNNRNNSNNNRNNSNNNRNKTI
tara:strand:+ start:107 stop:589 length:483 start_codon:yes stop_codon:yes gene_type:complete